MADIVDGEHRVQIAAKSDGQGKAAAPEKWLNCFVRIVALIERVGNALGTLAFTWATVVLLGGYPTALRPQDDFWYATAIVFLEAARMFSGSNNRPDYQLFFRTRGAFRPPGWNRLVAIVCISDVSVFLTLQKKIVMAYVVVYAMVILLALGQNTTAEFQPLYKPLRRAMSLWSPLAAILLLTPAMQNSREFIINITGEREIITRKGEINVIPSRSTVAKWTVFVLLLVAVLVVTISRLRFPKINKLVDSALGRNLLVWGRAIQNMCMLAALVMLVLTIDGPFRYEIILELVGVTVIVSAGNFQLPVAVSRAQWAGVALKHLTMPHNDYSENKENPDSKTNLVPSLIIFYGMVMAQGILYIVACILEILSFIPRRSLVRHAGFGGQLGVEYVNMYYAYAFEKCMGGAVFAPKKTSLSNFAMDSLNSDSPKNHLYGVQLMHSLLKKETTKVRLLEKLTISTKTMTRIISMLGWTTPNYMTVRLYAAKRLTSIGGEIGITLRYKISKHPFLLRNLAEILGNNNSDQELSKIVARILRNLAIDGDTRKKIGHMQLLITRLMKSFLNLDRTSSTKVDCLLPKVAGQALAMLATDNVHSCLVMLKEPEFINKLKNMILINDEKYTYVATSLVRSMCQHARAKLTESDLKELSHTLPEVLERIMEAEGAELEILIGLSSQICRVIPEEFSQELEHGQIKRRFVKRLVDALNTNMKPFAHCPGIRRVILEQSIYMMECNSRYAIYFDEFRMMDTLTMVEVTLSRAENYIVILGDAGFMDCSTPLFALVDRARELMGRQWLQGITSAN
ncbi:hypothetical protein E2562_011408 [Oryza meyeriana var. granulata]|uniref:BLE2 protein n=1 Tax=Oryza meyeriana var. granulata TaxID=110450 RepID=A0A6G1D1Z2_9ORYZ|nr:hypothetical protein E2562_011408 [Oryza meyeriana var. granulata]